VARVPPGLALVLAGVLGPIVLWAALEAVIAVLDRLARSLGVAEGRMPNLAAVLLVLPAAGPVFTAIVLVTLLIPEGRRLLGRTNPDPAARRRYCRSVLWASLAPFLLLGLALAILDPFFAWLTRAGWGGIEDAVGSAAYWLSYGLSLLAGLVFIMRLPFRLRVRGLLGLVYAALVGFLLVPFTWGLAFAFSGEAL
jgi:hypothetical protein